MCLQKSPFPPLCCHRGSGQTNVTRVSPQCQWLGQNLQLGEFKRWESQQELPLSAPLPFITSQKDLGILEGINRARNECD